LALLMTLAPVPLMRMPTKPLMAPEFALRFTALAAMPTRPETVPVPLLTVISLAVWMPNAVPE
jgi:hypothetical protein